MYIIYDNALVGLCCAKQTKTSLYLVVGVDCSIDLFYNAEQHCTIDLIERQVRRKKLRKQTKKKLREQKEKVA